MKKVYYDVENTLDLPFITGIQRVVREFSKAALQAGANMALKHQYIPVIYDHRRQYWRKLNKFETRALLSDKARSLSLPNRLLAKLIKLRPYKHLMLEQFEPGSVFLDIESSWHSKLARESVLPTLVASKVLSIKVHYDIIPLLFPETSHPNTVRVFREHFTSHLKHTHLFLCISDTTRHDVEQYCLQHAVNQPRLATIQLGTHLANANKDHIDESNNAIQYGRYILSVGTIEPRKNFALLLKAFETLAKVSDLNLIIVGKIGWRSEEIRQTLHSNPLFGSRVHHLEDACDSQLNGLYKHAWLNVVPSLYEGFGLPVVEALARNCPTLCSDAGSLSEFDSKHVMFFKSDSLTELTKALSTLDSDPAHYAQLEEGAKSFKPVGWRETVNQVDDYISAFAAERS